MTRFPEVAAIVKPRWRGVLTEKQRCRLISLGRPLPISGRSRSRLPTTLQAGNYKPSCDWHI
ncbi:MAG TPA: hypothetical protein VNX28_00090, partial [Gemmataceae bacterium]|nr:hypothetical protein [Gemmataceae bacterium]